MNELGVAVVDERHSGCDVCCKRQATALYVFSFDECNEGFLVCPTCSVWMPWADGELTQDL